MEAPKNEILSAMAGIHAAMDQPANKRLAAIEYGNGCMANTRKIFDNMLGGQCNYIQLVAGGNKNLDIWAGSRIYMKREYSAWLLILNQGMICSSAYQSAFMHEHKMWVKSPKDDIKAWAKKIGYTDKMKKVG